MPPIFFCSEESKLKITTRHSAVRTELGCVCCMWQIKTMGPIFRPTFALTSEVIVIAAATHTDSVVHWGRAEIIPPFLVRFPTNASKPFSFLAMGAQEPYMFLCTWSAYTNFSASAQSKVRLRQTMAQRSKAMGMCVLVHGERGSRRSDSEVATSLNRAP